jgi:hypothetical protein
MNDTPETYEAVERWNKGNINIFDEMARLERERDEARAALMKIEDVFVDGEDTYEDWRTMGNIARAALEGAK